MTGSGNQVIGRRVGVAGPELGDAELGEGEGANVRCHGSVPRIVEHRPRRGERLAQVAPRSRAVQVGGRGAHREPMSAIRRQAPGHAVGQREERVRASILSGVEQDPGQCQRELGVPGHDLRRDPVHQLEERRALPPGQETQPVSTEHVRGQLPVLSEQRVAKGGKHLVSLAIPASRPRMELGPIPWHAVPELDAQQLPEKRVVREPQALVVERRNEHALAHELLEAGLTAVGLGDRVGERAVQLLHDRGAEQEVERLGRLTGDHLTHQVVAHSAIVAGEASDEAAGVGVVVKRQRREPETRHPALRALPEQLQVGVANGQVQGTKELPGLARGEREIGVSDLAEHAGDAQSLESERGVGPGDQHEAQPVGSVIEQHAEVAHHGRVGHLVEVVEDEHDRLRQRLERRHEAGKECAGLPRPGAAMPSSWSPARSSAAITPVQKARRELASAPSASHATRREGSWAAAQLERRAVLPAPAGAAIRATGRSIARASLAVTRGRSTIPGGMGGGTSFVARTSSRSVGSTAV